jgi:hypothetical protein
MLKYLFVSKCDNKIDNVIDDFNIYKRNYMNIVNTKNIFLSYLEKIGDDINDYITTFDISNIEKKDIISEYKKNNIHNKKIIYKNINIYYLINKIIDSFNDSLKYLLNQMKIIKNDNFILIDKDDYTFEFKNNCFFIYHHYKIIFDINNKEIFIIE